MMDVSCSMKVDDMGKAEISGPGKVMLVMLQHGKEDKKTSVE